MTATPPPLWLVAGAPGAGKSAVAAALLAAQPAALVFDIDWLAGPASALVGRSIVEAAPL